jgi:hypothetical protein
MQIWVIVNMLVCVSVCCIHSVPDVLTVRVLAVEWEARSILLVIWTTIDRSETPVTRTYLGQ